MADKMTLDAFARPRTFRQPVVDWLNAHPELKQQALDGAQQYGYSQIYRWLRSVHKFPHSLSQLYVVLRTEKETKELDNG